MEIVIILIVLIIIAVVFVFIKSLKFVLRIIGIISVVLFVISGIFAGFALWEIRGFQQSIEQTSQFLFIHNGEVVAGLRSDNTQHTSVIESGTIDHIMSDEYEGYTFLIDVQMLVTPQEWDSLEPLPTDSKAEALGILLEEAMSKSDGQIIIQGIFEGTIQVIPSIRSISIIKHLPLSNTLLATAFAIGG